MLKIRLSLCVLSLYIYKTMNYMSRFFQFSKLLPFVRRTLFFFTSYRVARHVSFSVSVIHHDRMSGQRLLTNFFGSKAAPIKSPKAGSTGSPAGSSTATASCSKDEPDAASPVKPEPPVKRTRRRVVSSSSEDASPVKKSPPQKENVKGEVSVLKRAAPDSTDEAVTNSPAVKPSKSPATAKPVTKKSPVAAKPVKKDSKLKSTPESAKKKAKIETPSPKPAAIPPGKPISLDSYNPLKKDYDPVIDACWSPDDPTPFGALAVTLQKIEDTSARLEIIRILCNFLRSVIVLTPQDVVSTIHLCLSRLGPAHEALELGVADRTLIEAIAGATGKKPANIKADLAKKGDLGLVAEACRGSQQLLFGYKPGALTVPSIYKDLLAVARMSGAQSSSMKQNKIKGLLNACDIKAPCEARYLVRLLSGKLRIGLAEQSVLAALANALTLCELAKTGGRLSKERLDADALIVKTAYVQCPIYERVVEVALRDCIASLPSHCSIQPGVPVKPMLAHPTKNVAEVLRRFGDCEFACEYKYDGERAQIHYARGGVVSIYSRNQENHTEKYPDVVELVPKIFLDGVESFVIDSEVVAWDVEKRQILPFQVLSTRKRKDIEKNDITVQVCLFAFDLLYFNGKSLVEQSFRERRALLYKNFKCEDETKFTFAVHKDTSESDEIMTFLDEAVKNSCEGLMVKTLDTHATYDIAKRSHSWLKVKKDYLDGVGDTFDLVVIGAYTGTGKRAGVYGGFLLACYEPESEEFQSICKVGTGFSDEQLAQSRAFFEDHVIPKPKSYYRFDDSIAADVWFDAVQVWEIKAADLSISPRHHAALGLVDKGKGISLRFPRFERIRDDKTAENATSARQVAEMYRSQEQIKNVEGNNEEEDDY